MTKDAATIPILMYHSISESPGPTSIPVEVFADQMQAIAEEGWSVIPLSELASWHSGKNELPNKTLAITFDDGFTDFHDCALPILMKHGFHTTMFVPTQRVGREEDWAGHSQSPRKIMDWETLTSIDGNGVEIAPHSRSHADLSALSASALEDEVLGSKSDLENRLGRQVRHFAPPYGRVNEAVLNCVGDAFDISVGVELGLATRRSDIRNLPRLEMHYYRDGKQWRRFLRGQGAFYLSLRKMLRTMRQRVKPKFYA